jgi:23S rRNA pseudouridine1911/1915/1917 synthase
MEVICGTISATVTERLDRHIADTLGMLTRSQLKTRLVRALINGREVRLSRLVKGGESFVLELRTEPEHAAVAEDLVLPIIYRDSRVVVVDKPQGMVTHPAHGNWSGTLANGLLGLLADRSARLDPSMPGQAPARAGIVHRLDKDTSGVIIAALDATTQECLAAQFRDRSTRKIYLAIVQGAPPEPAGRLESWLARDPRNRKRFAPNQEGRGKRAVSDWKILAAGPAYCLLALRPRTGRTHQLRVHCRQLGCPIVGDPIYGSRDRALPGATLMLHALELSIQLPGETGQRHFVAPLPEHFRLMLDQLGLTWHPDAVTGSI